MSHGLQIFGPFGQTWFDSTLAQAGVPVDYVNVPASTYDPGTFTWTVSTVTNTYTGYANFTLKPVYLSNMFLEITNNSGPAEANPTISVTNYGVSTATVLIIATASI